MRDLRVGGLGVGAGRTSACSRAVNSPPPTPSTASAWRQPSVSTSQAPSGADTVEASPPATVMTVSLRATTVSIWTSAGWCGSPRRSWSTGPRDHLATDGSTCTGSERVLLQHFVTRVVAVPSRSAGVTEPVPVVAVLVLVDDGTSARTSSANTEPGTIVGGSVTTTVVDVVVVATANVVVVVVVELMVPWSSSSGGYRRDVLGYVAHRVGASLFGDDSRKVQRCGIGRRR